MENKPENSLVVSLGKALNGTPPPLCGRQVARPGEEWALPGVLAQDSLHDGLIYRSSAALQRQPPRDKNKTKQSILVIIYTPKVDSVD